VARLTFKLDTTQAVHDLDRVRGKVRRNCQRAIAESALNIQREARKRCPVDTGNLRSSIQTDFRIDRLGAEVGTRTFYGVFQEFGTKPSPGRYVPAIRRRIKTGTHPGVKARPFLRPAAEQERPHFIESLRRAYEQGARKR